MALTIEQTPRKFSLSGHKMIFVLTSDNYTEEGFKVKVDITDDQIGLIGTLYVSPNASGSIVLDISSFWQGKRQDELNGLIHQKELAQLSPETIDTRIIYLTFTEYWIIDNVLTENVDSGIISDYIYVNRGFYPPKKGFNPDPEGTDSEVAFTLNSNTKRMWSDRKWDSHIPPSHFPLSPDTDRIFIPVRDTDYGVIYFSSNSTFLSNVDVATIKIILTKADNTNIAWSFTPTGATPYILGIYPANINGSFDMDVPKPEDHPDWIYYTVRAFNGSDVAKSVEYVFYNVDVYGQTDCKHDNVRLAWANSRAGWDYFNFTKKNEQQLNIQRKRYYSIPGNYATATDTFTYAASDGGLTERTPIVEDYLNITSDWIQEGEFEFLKSLLISNQVHWVQTDGTHIPVVIENSDYTVKRERNGKLKNLELKLRMAHNLL